MLLSGSWKLETGSWKLGAGSWKLETGSWKLEAGGWKLGSPIRFIVAFDDRLKEFVKLFAQNYVLFGEVIIFILRQGGSLMK